MHRAWFSKNLNWSRAYREESQRVVDFYDEISRLTGEEPDWVLSGFRPLTVRNLGQFRAIFMQVSSGIHMLMFMDRMCNYTGPDFTERVFFRLADLAEEQRQFQQVAERGFTALPADMFTVEFQKAINLFCAEAGMPRHVDRG